MSVCRVPGLRDNITLRSPCTVSQAHVTQLPLNVCVTCARFTSQYFASSVSVRCAWFPWHNCPKKSLCRVPDLRNNTSNQNVSVSFARLTLDNFPKTFVCRVLGLRDNICPITYLYGVTSLRNTIVLKRRSAVCPAYVTKLT